jgi:hypothetical protein
LYRSGSILMSVALVALGIAMVVRALTAGGGALSVGVVVGVLFVGLGAGRLYLWKGRT